MDVLKKTQPQLDYQDFLGNMVHAISLRTDQPPFTAVRVRRAISRAIDRRALIDAVGIRGEPSGPLSRGLKEWALPVDQLGEGAKYLRYGPRRTRLLSAGPGTPNR